MNLFQSLLNITLQTRKRSMDTLLHWAKICSIIWSKSNMWYFLCKNRDCKAPDCWSVNYRCHYHRLCSFQLLLRILNHLYLTTHGHYQCHYFSQNHQFLIFAVFCNAHQIRYKFYKSIIHIAASQNTIAACPDCSSEIFLSKKGIFIKWNIPQICPNCQNLRRRFCTLKVSLLFRRSYASNNVHILYFTPIASSPSLCNSSFPVSSALWSISYVYHRLVPIILSWREMAYGTAGMIPFSLEIFKTIVQKFYSIWNKLKRTYPFHKLCTQLSFLIF